MEIKDVYPNKVEGFPVRLNYEYCDRLIGKRLGQETIKRIVQNLEMRIVKEDDLGLDLIVPPYRVDVKRPCDVVEDILRIYGYNNVEIPTTLKSSLTIAGEADKEFRRENQVSEQLVGAGFNEILNNSLTKQAYYDENLYNCYPWARTVKVRDAPDAPLRRTGEHRPQRQPQGAQPPILRGGQRLSLR